MAESRIKFIFLVIFICLMNKSKNDILNNIINIEGDWLIDFFPLQMPNKDFVLIFNDIRENLEGESISVHLIYELKSSGEFFGDNIIETILIYNEKYLSTLLIIGNNKYPLICDLDNCLSLDLRNLNYNSKDFHSLLQEAISGENYCDHIINLDNKSKILFSRISNNNIYLSIVNIYDKDLSFQSIAKSEGGPRVHDFTHELNCFITNNNYIECLYINSDNTYHVAIYGHSLQYINDILLDSDSIIFNSREFFYNSIKAIHLKNEIGIFAYYINNVGYTVSNLIIQINELYFEGGIPIFRSVIQGENKKIVFLMISIMLDMEEDLKWNL